MKPRDAEILRHMPIVRKIARYYASCRLCEYADLVAFGAMGLVQAIEMRDENFHEQQFMRYLRTRVRGAIIDGIRVMQRETRYLDYVPVKSVYELREQDDWDHWDTTQQSYDDRIELIPAMIAELDDLDRLVIELYYYGHKSLAEIGQDLGFKEARACQIHKRALKKLRKHL